MIVSCLDCIHKEECIKGNGKFSCPFPITFDEREDEDE